MLEVLRWRSITPIVQTRLRLRTILILFSPSLVKPRFPHEGQGHFQSTIMPGEADLTDADFSLSPTKLSFNLRFIAYYCIGVAATPLATPIYPFGKLVFTGFLILYELGSHQHFTRNDVFLALSVSFSRANPINWSAVRFSGRKQPVVEIIQRVSPDLSGAFSGSTLKPRKATGRLLNAMFREGDVSLTTYCQRRPKPFPTDRGFAPLLHYLGHRRPKQGAKLGAYII